MAVFAEASNASSASNAAVFCRKMLTNKLFNLFSGINKFLKLNPTRLYHASPVLLKCEHWKSYNEKIFPPQKPNEPQRGAYCVHVIEDVKYSIKKMFHIARFVRGMSVDEALKQLEFVNRKGGQIVRDAILEAQEKAVKEHNVEFKSNLWVSESFATKSFRVKGMRRHGRGRMGRVEYKFIHYFVNLEEGKPPKYYNVHRAPRTGEQMLNKFLEKFRHRRIYCSM